MKIKILIFISLIALSTFFYTKHISTDFIKSQFWKNYEGINSFGDCISFRDFSVADNGTIYARDGLKIGKITEKHHNYMNTFITVEDEKGKTSVFIAK